MAKDKKSTYYDVGGIEVIDYVKAKLPPDQYKGWLLGQAMTYLSRAQYKFKGFPADEKRDYEKAEFYCRQLVEEAGAVLSALERKVPEKIDVKGAAGIYP